MTRGGTIFLNAAASYGRALFVLFCGVFTSRWTYNALGETDYGLYGLLGGLLFIIYFFSGVFFGSASRFFAVAVGRAHSEGTYEALEECRGWFSSAFPLFMILPLVLGALTLPVGEWIIDNALEIPPERVAAMKTAFYFVTATAVADMMSSPYAAMYHARQEIATLTCFSIAYSAVNLCFVFYMECNPGIWFTRYVIWLFILDIASKAAMCLYAHFRFAECRIRVKSMWNASRLKAFFAYSGWQSVRDLGNLFRVHLLALFTGGVFGPKANAGLNVSGVVEGQANSLAASVAGAFAPSLYSAAGAGDEEFVSRMVSRVSKIVTALSLLFFIPLTIEIGPVLSLWLKEPPASAAPLCVFAMAATAVAESVTGFDILANARGRVARYQTFSGVGIMTVLPLAWILHIAGLPFAYSTGAAILASTLISVAARLAVAKREFSASVLSWFREVAAPLLVVSALAGCAGIVPRLWLGESMARLCLSVLLCEAVLVPAAWFFVFSSEERAYVSGWIKSVARRLK